MWLHIWLHSKGFFKIPYIHITMSCITIKILHMTYGGLIKTNSLLFFVLLLLLFLFSVPYLTHHMAHYSFYINILVQSWSRVVVKLKTNPKTFNCYATCCSILYYNIWWSKPWLDFDSSVLLIVVHWNHLKNFQ